MSSASSNPVSYTSKSRACFLFSLCSSFFIVTEKIWMPTRIFPSTCTSDWMRVARIFTSTQYQNMPGSCRVAFHLTWLARIFCSHEFCCFESTDFYEAGLIIVAWATVLAWRAFCSNRQTAALCRLRSQFCRMFQKSTLLWIG